MSEIDRILDEVDPFGDDVVDPPFSEGQLQELRSAPGADRRLAEIVTDRAAPLKRRFAAVEALAQGGWKSTLDAVSAPAAEVLAEALAADSLHNRWGLPGVFVGRAGRLLLSLPEGVEPALEGLLGDTTELTIAGSEEATIQQARRYRVSDLASYLLSERRT